MPLWLIDLRKGDRVLLQELDNSRHLVEITSAGHGAASGRRLDGLPAAKVESVRAWQLLCREGEPIVKHAGNLVPGDLVYTPKRRSGFQYAKAVMKPRGLVGLIRWNEIERSWAKHSEEVPPGTKWIAHESEPGALEAFFARIEVDRADWIASPGRSHYKLNRETGEVEWRAKERRWRGPTDK